MGGDFAPEAIVRGAVDCARDARCDFDILLVGEESRIREALGADGSAAHISVVHAAEVVGMHDSPTAALKTKKNSSIQIALDLQRDGRADGFVSAGNTGAVMAATTLTLGRIDGVSRPTIGTFLPTTSGWTLLVDAGANVDSKPLHLQQFGVMGSIFTEHMLGTRSPKVGLLSVGEEKGKGDAVTVEAHELLAASPINFVGNIEGRDILSGKVDVAVCDGFVGNIILKFAESFPVLLKTKFREYAERGILNKLRMAVTATAVRSIFKGWDYQEQGGVPLLGVNGVSIIGHGSSTPKAITNMILKAKEMIDRKVNERIAVAMRQLVSR